MVELTPLRSAYPQSPALRAPLCQTFLLSLHPPTLSMPHSIPPHPLQPSHHYRLPMTGHHPSSSTLPLPPSLSSQLSPILLPSTRTTLPLLLLHRPHQLTIKIYLCLPMFSLFRHRYRIRRCRLLQSTNRRSSPTGRPLLLSQTNFPPRRRRLRYLHGQAWKEPIVIVGRRSR